MSIGIYGLAQTLFQVPFGIWSDRWGRKPVLTVALAVFVVGSVICAQATSAWVLVLGRLVQGMGAIASVVVAMVADLTRDRVRTRAMAMVGVSIGASFAIGLLVGPALSETVGVPFLFRLTAGLTVLGIGYLWWKIPTPPRLRHRDELEYSREHLFEVLTNLKLLRLDLGVFNLHMTLAAIFVAIPFVLRGFIPTVHQWRLFLPLMAAGFVTMLVAAHIGEKPGRSKRIVLLGQALLVAAAAAFALCMPGSALDPGGNVKWLVAGLFLFVGAFALLEPLFPSLLTRLCSQTNRGTAAGIFNMSQFSGAFLGGLLAGFFLERDLEALFWILAATSGLWLVSAIRLHDPRNLSTLDLEAHPGSEEERRALVRRLHALEGVEDVAWKRDENRLLLRVDPAHLDRDRLDAELATPLSGRG
jgi:MFS family permease